MTKVTNYSAAKCRAGHAAELNKGEIAECAIPPEPDKVLALGNLVGSDFAWSMKKKRPERKKQTLQTLRHDIFVLGATWSHLELQSSHYTNQSWHRTRKWFKMLDVKNHQLFKSIAAVYCLALFSSELYKWSGATSQTARIFWWTHLGNMPKSAD